MRDWGVRACTLFLLMLLGSVFADDPEVTRYLNQLGADSHAERKAADQALRQRLPAARVQIAAFMKTAQDPEVRERIADMPLQLHVAVAAPSAYQKQTGDELIGAMAVWSKGKGIVLSRHQEWVGRFPTLVQSLLAKPTFDYVVVDLLGSSIDPSKFEHLPAGAVVFVGSTPVPKRKNVVLDREAALRMLIETCRREQPEADEWAVFPGVRSEATNVRARAFAKAMKGRPIKTHLADPYANTWAPLRGSLKSTFEKHPGSDVIIDLADGQLSTLLWNSKKPVYSVHAHPGALLDARENPLSCVIELPPEEIAATLMPMLAQEMESPPEKHVAETRLVKPKQVRTKEAAARVLHLRQLALEGRVAIQAGRNR